MQSLQIISVVDDLRVTSVEELAGSSPRAVKVTALGGMRAAQRVEINNYGVDSFIVLSDKALRVIPGDVFSDVLAAQMNVFVLSGAFTSPKKARLVLALTKQPRMVEGFPKLVQLCIRVLLTRSGSNRYDVADGGSLLDNLGETLSPESSAQLSAGIANSVQRAAEYVQEVQSGVPLPLSEKLLTMELTSLQFVASAGEVQATIRIVSGTGSTVELPLTL